jgi:hypothetical protein
MVCKGEILALYGSTMTKKRRTCFFIIWGINFRYSNCIENYKTSMTDHIENISIVRTHTTRLPPIL